MVAQLGLELTLTQPGRWAEIVALAPVALVPALAVYLCHPRQLL
jgi:hypothetical protein